MPRIVQRATTLTLGLALMGGRTQAALLPAVSEDLSGRPVATFQSETLEGRTVTSDELLQQPTIINFFASWCPVCQMEIGALRALTTDLRLRGISMLGVLVDPVETPDTVQEARDGLARDPLPFPVLLMNPALRDAFRYEGFPATYFVTGHGTFSTTLLGFQPKEKIEEVATRLLIGAPVAAAPTGTAFAPGAGGSPHHEWEKSPLRALLPGHWQEWHPLIIHFPITLLALEAVGLAVFWLRSSAEAARMSGWCLSLAVLMLVPSVWTGILDDGASLGPGSAFWNGVHDRLGHFFRLESSISVHVLFMVAAGGLAGVRLGWRALAGDRVLAGRRAFVFGALTVAGLWLLFGGAQVGGGISHP